MDFLNSALDTFSRSNEESDIDSTLCINYDKYKWHTEDVNPMVLNGKLQISQWEVRNMFIRTQLII